MGTIKIEIPADRPDLALVLGEALRRIGNADLHPKPAAGEVASGGAEDAAGTVHDKDINAGFTSTSMFDKPDTGEATAVDTKGVPFSSETCSQAKEPFYSSGPRVGQWKKRKGVSDEDYDRWYTDELSKLGGTSADEPNEYDQSAPVNTAGAFSQQQAGPQQAPPKDTGEFMGWVSEKQAAGLLTQDDIQEAYSLAGVKVTDLFPPNDAQAVAGRIGQLYDVLSGKAGA